jgi:hypothetical protein
MLNNCRTTQAAILHLDIVRRRFSIDERPPGRLC